MEDNKAARLMDRVVPLKLMTLAVIMGLVAYAMLLLCGTMLSGNTALDVVFCTAGVPYGLCLGMSMPLNQSIAVKNTPPNRWGAANALFQLAIDCGIGATCLLWGIINDAFGFPVTIVCVMVFIAAALLTAKLCYPKQ